MHEVDRHNSASIVRHTCAVARTSCTRTMRQPCITPYATAASDGGHAVGLVVSSWEGRPTKVEGNKEHPASLGGTDARLWRYRNIQACVYGPFPHGMGSFDEHVDIEEFLHIVRTHALSACDFLSG